MKPKSAPAQPEPSMDFEDPALSLESKPMGDVFEPAVLPSAGPVAPVGPAASNTSTVPASRVVTQDGMQPVTASRDDRFSMFRFNRLAFMITGAVLIFITAIGVGSVLLSARHNGASGSGGKPQAADYAVGSKLQLNTVKGNDQLQIGDASQLAINGQLQVNDTLVLAPTSAPTSPTTGQIYYDQAANAPYYYNGKQFVSLVQQHVASIGGADGTIGLGQGLTLTGNQLSVSSALLQQIAAGSGSTAPGVSSLQGQTGNVRLTAGPGIGINGTVINNNGVISLAAGSPNLTVANDGSGHYTVTDSGGGSGVVSVTGTANQIIVSANTGNVTLSLPQNIGTASSPTFGGMTVTGTLAVQGANSLSLGTASGNTGSITLFNSANGNSIALKSGANTGNLSFTLPTAYGSNGSCLKTDGSGTLSFEPCTGGAGGGVTSFDGLVGVLTLNNSSGSGTAITIDNAAADGTTKGIATFNAADFVDNGSGTIDTVQGIALTSTPTFGGLTINGTAAATTLNATSAIQLNGADINTAGVLSHVAYLTGTGPQVFIGDNEFTGTVLTRLNSSAAFQIQNGTGTSNLFVADTATSRIGIGTLGPGYRLDVQGGDINTSGIYRVNGAQISSADLSNDNNLAKINGANIFTADNTFTGTVAIQGSNSLTLGGGSNAGSIIFGDGVSANTGTLQLGGTLAGNATFSLPVASGSQTLCTVELGNCAGSGSGITGAGTPGKLAKFTGSQAVGDSSISDDGTVVTVSTGQIIQGSAGLTLGASGVNGQLIFKNSSNAGTLTLQSGATTGNLILTLPTGDGSNGDCLETNGLGVLSFANCTGGAGGGVTSINTLTGVLNVVGTTNQVSVSSAGDTITLSLPQDINTGGNATFRTVTLTGQAAGDNLIVANAVSGATGKLIDLKVNSASKFTVDPSGNVNTVGQYQVNGAQISSANLSNDSDLAKLSGTGPQIFTGNNEFTGTVLSQLDSPTAFQVQNAAGTSNLLVADTTTTRLGVGTATPGYTLDVNGDINTNGVYRINGVTVCSASGCTASSGSGSYIQNQTASPQVAGFNITGAGTVGSLTDTGAALFETATDSPTAFQIQDHTGTSNLLVADTTHNLIGIGVQPTVGAGALQIAGTAAATGYLEANADTNIQVTVGNNCTTANNAICFGGGINLYNYNNGASLATDGLFQAGNLYTTGSLSFGTFHETTFTTPTGASVDTKISIPLFDPGAYSQLIALGLPFGSSTFARAITVFDDRATTNNQPPLAVISPDESNLFGLSWEGASTTGYLKVGSGGAIDLRSGVNDLANFNSGGAATFKTYSPVTNAFQLLNRSNDEYLQADSANGRLGVGLLAAPANGVLTVGTNTTTASGGLYFGADTAANLYRSAAGTLTTDAALTVGQDVLIQGNQLSFGTGATLIANGSAGSLELQGARFFFVGSTATDPAYCSATNTDPECRFQMRTDGLLEWGPGSGAVDTDLYRGAAGQLKTDSSLVVKPTGGSATALQVQDGSGGSVFTVDSSNAAARAVLGGTNKGDSILQFQRSGTNTYSIGSDANSLGGADSFFIYNDTESAYVAAFRNNGAVAFQNSTDSATAFQIQNASPSNTPLFTADTTDMRIQIGNAGTPVGQLFVSGSAPSGAVGSVSIGGSGPGIQDIRVSGNYGYALDYNNSKFYTLDLSDPTNPTILNTAGTGTATSGGPQALYIAGHYAYIGDFGAQKLEIFDISNPKAPSLTGTLSGLGQATSLYVSGNYVYFGTNSGTIAVIDVSNPANPSLVTTVSTNNVGSIFVSGNYLYDDDSGGIFRIFNVSDPANPVAAGTVYTGGAPGCTGGIVSPQGVYVSGKYAYVTVCATGLTQIYDVSNPASPSLTGSINTGGGPIAVNVQGRYAYIALYNSSRMAIYDVSNPASPVSIGITSTGASSGPDVMSVQGRYAYVGDLDDGKVNVLDLGGAYVQQFEAGGLQTGQLNVNGNSTLVGDTDIQGGLNVGTNAQINGALGVSGPVSLQNSSDSTAAFQIANSAGDQLLSVDTTSYSNYLGGKGSINVAGGTTLQFGDNIILGQDTGANGTFHIDSYNTGGVSISNGSNSGTGSTTAFQVQKAGGGTVLNVDNQNSTVSVTAGTDTATLGTELMTSSNSFPATTGWGSISGTGQAATATHVSGTTALHPTPALGISSGNLYQVTWTITNPNSGGTLNITMGGQTVTSYSFDDNTGGTYSADDSAVIYSSSSANLAFTPNAAFTGTISNVSVKQLTPNEAPALVVNDASGGTNLEVRASSDNSNLFFGVNAGQFNVTGQGFQNLALGSNALAANSIGYLNVAIGDEALMNNTSGQQNLAIGAQTLQYNTSGSLNIAIGSYALQSNTFGGSNVAVGNNALQNNTGGLDNVAVGNDSLNSNTTGNELVAVGSGALANNTTGTANTALGYASSRDNLTGYNNSSFGAYSLEHNTGHESVAFGTEALQYNTTGNQNTALGTYSLVANSTGGDNVAVGYSTLTTNTTGWYNTALGNGADVIYGGLQGATAIGSGAAVGSSNTIILGYNTNYGVNDNVGIGTSYAQNPFEVAPNTDSDGTISQASGSGTVVGSGTSFSTVMLGATLFYPDGSQGIVTAVTDATHLTSSNTTGGWAAGTTYAIVWGGFNVNSDASVFLQNTTDSAHAFTVDNTAGNDILRVTTDNSDYALTVSGGVHAAGGVDLDNNDVLQWNSNGTSTSIQGSDNGVNSYMQFTVNGNVALAIGNDGAANFLGAAAVFSSSANSATAFQVQQTGGGATVLDVDNQNMRVGIGKNNPAYALDVTGDINTTTEYRLGGNIVLQSPHSANNIFVGDGAGNVGTTASANTALGYFALHANATGNWNTAIGGDALFYNTSGASNTALGDFALYNTTGSSNTGLGYNAGYNITSGSNNIIIGSGINAPSATASNQLNIGNVLYGDLSNDRICINVSSCTHTLGVSGTIAASGAITASTTPDISETIPAGDDVTPGDVVSAGPDGHIDAVRSSVPYDPTAIGVISDGSSSFKINSNADSEGSDATGKYLVLAGRVPVHVTDENGPIEPGDYLTTSSTPGYAMKATHAGPTIGKALTAFDGTSGTVMTQTNLSYYGGPSETDIVQNGGNATLTDLTVGGMTDLADLNVSGTATINNLTVTGSATIASLTVTGSAQFAGDITVGGHVITAGVTPVAQTEAAAGSGATCTITGNDTGGSITIVTGTAGVADGSQCTLTFHDAFSKAPNPVVSPRSKTGTQTGVFVDANTSKMTVEFANAPAPDTSYTFNYFNAQ